MQEKSKLEKLSAIKLKFKLPLFLTILGTITSCIIFVKFIIQNQNNAGATKELVVPVVQVKTLTVLGRLEPKGEIIKLAAPASSQGNRVEQLLIKEGTQVKSGQLIAILDNRDRLIAALAAAHEQVQVAQANLNKIKAGAKKGEIEAQKATIAQIQAELDAEIQAQQATINRLDVERKAETEAQQASIAQFQAQIDNALAEEERYRKLYQQGAIAISILNAKSLTLTTAIQQQAQAKANLKLVQTSKDQQLIEARANLKRIQTSRSQQLIEARATLDRITEVRSVDVVAAEAEVNRAIADVKIAKANLQQAFVYSPQDGEIFKIRTHPGELVSNEGIVEIGQTSQMYAVLEVYQSEIHKVRLGQKVQVLSDSIAGELLGTVAQISSQVQRQDVINSDPTTNIDSRIVEAHVKLDLLSSQKAAKFSNLQVKAVIEL